MSPILTAVVLANGSSQLGDICCAVPTCIGSLLLFSYIQSLFCPDRQNNGRQDGTYDGTYI